MSSVNFEDPILDSTFAIIHKELTDCSSMALNFGHSTLLYMAWISSFSNLVVRFLHIGIHSFILIFIWANDFSDGWVSTWMGLFVFKFVLTLHLNYSSNWITYDGIDYVCKYYCHPLQNYKSLLHWKAISKFMLHTIMQPTIHSTNQWPQLVEHSEKLAIVFGERLISVNIPPRLSKGHQEWEGPTLIYKPTNPPHAFNFGNFKIYSWNRVKACHHVMSTSILMGLTSPLDDDLVHVILRKITFAWDVHHLFKNRLPVKVIHKVYSNFCDPKVLWRACRTLVNFLISNLSLVHCQISKTLSVLSCHHVRVSLNRPLKKTRNH